MIPGAVYRLTWFEEQTAGPGFSVEDLRFKGEHPTGMLMFERLDGFSIHLHRRDVWGCRLAEASA